MIAPIKAQKITRSFVVVTTLLLSFLVLLSSCSFKTGKSGDYSGSDGRSATASSCPSGLICEDGLLIVKNTSSTSAVSVVNSALQQAMSSSSYCNGGCVIDVRALDQIKLTQSGSQTSTSGFEKITGLDSNVWVVGNGKSNTAINGNQEQPFHINDSSNYFFALQSLTVKDSKVRGGNAGGGAGSGMGAGGAIYINKGLVIADQVAFTNNRAEGGTSSSTAGKGGNGGGNKGAAGTDGARMNASARYKGDASGGAGGDGGATCSNSHSGVCDASSYSYGTAGGFGAGGGSAGGGGSDADSNSKGDRARDGASGGKGGFGGGGGGGGGGGADDGEDKNPEVGSGGSGGSGGPFASGGYSGSRGESSSDDVGGSGGKGGAGAGLGGAVFVRKHNGANFKFHSGTLSSNDVSSSDKTACGQTINNSGSNAIFSLDSWSSSTESCSVTLIDNGTSNYNSSGTPSVSISIVGLSGNPREKFFEGQRAFLKVQLSSSKSLYGKKLYLYLSDNNAFADYGSGNIGNDKNADFGWGGSRLIALDFPNKTTSVYYADINNQALVAASEPSPYLGIPLYLDEELEGSETFDISLLTSPYYKLPSATNEATVRVQIEDANYRVALDSSDAKTEFCDTADALETATGTLAACETAPVADEINVENLKGLGYVTVKALRPSNVFRASKTASLQESDWIADKTKSSSLVIGSLFNNALAGGLPVHYALTGETAGVLSNQINYNNANYEGLTDPALSLPNAQISQGVVIPAVSFDINSLDPDNPPDIDSLGEAKIYFSTLPDAIKESAQAFTLTLTTFTDPSYNEDNFCTSDLVDHCSNLFNTPEGDYQFYSVAAESHDYSAQLTIHDAGEFQPSILIIDNINGELVTDASSSSNPLMIDESGHVTLWVRLGSQPTSDVQVSLEGSELNFTAQNWFLFQKVNVSASATLAITATSNDSNYGSSVNRTLDLVSNPNHFKVKEGQQTELSSRKVVVGVHANMKRFNEGQAEAPSYKLVFGQPLPFATQVTLNIAVTRFESQNITTDTEQRVINVPAWRQAFDFDVPFEDNNTSDPIRHLVADVMQVSRAGTVLENIVPAPDLKSASIVVFDDEAADVVLTQHLPAAPTPKDVARVMPRVKILGVNPDGSLQVQHNDNRITGINIQPVCDGSCDGESQINTKTYGLFMEFIDNTPVVADGVTQQASRGSIPFDYIQPTRDSYKGKVNFSATPLHVNDHPKAQIIRQSGYLTVETSGFYRFSATNSSANAEYELWLNTKDDYSQTKQLILPYFEDANADQVPDAPVSDTSASIELLAGKRYFIETLYEAGQSDSTGDLRIQYQHSTSENGTYSALADIPLQWLEPNAIGAGFYVDTYENISQKTLDEFVSSPDYQADNATRKEFYTNTLALNSLDAAEKVGRKIRATIVAPESGDYQFAIASNGDSSLWFTKSNDDKQKIAWVDGNERAGIVQLDSSRGSYVGQANYTRLEVTAIRDPLSDKNWSFLYKMKEDSIGTGPYGANTHLNIFDSLSSTSPINQTPACVDVGYGQHLRYDPANFSGTVDSTTYPDNSISVKTSTECMQSTTLADGTQQLVFTMWDYAGETNVDDYTFTHINGNPIEFADYPSEFDWYWSQDDSGQTSGPENSQQQSQPIHLTKGETYSIEIAQLNTKQEDHFAVAWKLPSSDTFEVMDTDHIAFTERTLPVSIVEASGALPTINANSEVSLALAANSFVYAGKEYVVSAITLAGEPVVAQGEALPYAAPGWLEFTSGFAATVKNSATITASPSAVVLTPQDRASDSSSINLTVGQQQRIGIQLASAPPAGVTLNVDIAPTAVGAEQNEAQVELYCQAGSGSSCESFIFTANNWDQPQFVTVLATQEGTNNLGQYQPDISIVDIQVSQEGASDYHTDLIKVNVFPDSSETDSTYFAMAKNAGITQIALSNPASQPITVTNQDTEQELSWSWTANASGTLIAASDASNNTLLTIRAMSSDQEAALLNGIPSGTEPVDLTVQLFVGPSFYRAEDLNSANIRISDVALMLTDDSAEQPIVAANLDINIENGRPYVSLQSIQSGMLANQAAVNAFSYVPSTSAGAQPISASATETIITEYGELSLVKEANQWKWRFASNPRPQASTIAFEVIGDSTTSETADIASFQQNAYLATSLSALPDLSKPRVVLTTKNNVSSVNEGDTATFVATLMNPQGDAEQTADQPLNIYYKVAQLGVTDPGNSALIVDDGSNPARSVQLSSSLTLLSDTQKTFTLEAWLQPESLTDRQQIFGGTLKTTTETTASILHIEGQQLVTGSGFSVALPTDVDFSNGFHVAWRASETHEAIFLNGEKLAEVAVNDHIAAISTMQLALLGSFDRYYFKGSVDELRVWSVARSDAQIAQIYNAALADVDDDTSHLSGYWAFNGADLRNQGNTELEAYLVDENDATLDLADVSVQQMVWFVRQPATQQTDYTGLEAAQAIQQQLLAMDAQQTQGRTTFALADLNQDKRLDVVVANREGEVSLHLSQASQHLNNAGQSVVYQRISTNINLGHAAPLLLTEIEGEPLLFAGLKNGKLGLVRDIMTAVRQQLATKSTDQTLQLPPMQTLSIEHPLLASRLANFNAQAKTTQAIKPLELRKLIFAPAMRGKQLVLASKLGVFAFNLQKHQKQWQLNHADIQGLTAISLTQGLFNRDIFPHFVDLDHDGDLDLILDTLHNLPGQTAGVMSYYQNYGSDAKPLFILAPRSRVADLIGYFDRYLDPTMRKRGQQQHPFDQVAYRQVADINGDGQPELVMSDNYGQINSVSLPNYFAVIAQGDTQVEIPVQIQADDEAETAEELTLQLVEGTPQLANYHFIKGLDRTTVTIEDTTQAGIQLLDDSNVEIDESTVIAVDEQNSTGTLYRIKLLSRPTEEVKVRVGSSDAQLGALLSADNNGQPTWNKFGQQIVLTFAPYGDDWRDGKAFWVAGTRDSVDDPNQEFAIVAVAASADPKYRQHTLVRKAQSTNNDDVAKLNFEYATLSVLDDAGAIVAGEGQVNAVTVSLNSQPTKPLSVTLQPTDSELTLYPQRKLVRALKVNESQQQVASTSARELSAAACTLPSGNVGVPALGRFGAWCWAENGEYRYEQARFDVGANHSEQLSFVIDNSYGKLSTDTLAVRLASAPETTLAEQILIYDLNSEQVLGDSNSELLLANNRVAELAAGADAPELIKTVSFGVRPASAPAEGEQISVVVSGAASIEPLIFSADNWQVWQRVDVESLVNGDELSIASDNYATTKTLTVVEQASPRLILQDWRTSQQILDNSAGNQVYAAQRSQGANHYQPVVLRARLSAAPSAQTTVSISGGQSITFNAEDYASWKPLAADTEGRSTLTIAASGGGYSDSRTLTVKTIELASRQGNFFNILGNLAGEALTLEFTPENWKIGQTIAVAAVDDDKVEYNALSTLDVSFADVNAVINGNYTRVSWQQDGVIRLKPKSITEAGIYVEKRLWLTDSDTNFDNHSLDIVITATENGDDIQLAIAGYLDAPSCVRDAAPCRENTTSQAFTSQNNAYELALALPSNQVLTAVSLAPLAAEYLAKLQVPIAVSIQDNDLPIVRAGVDLHAGENTHPGYFTLSVTEPVGIAGGLGVHYEIHGYVEGENFGAIAEVTPPDTGLADPGPDFQGFDTLQSGTAFIPEGKTRVSLPIFPIDDFTPEESLAARYEKVVLVLTPPTVATDYAGDNYRLDQRNTETQTAGVKILDNEDIGLKFVLPLDGLIMNEGGFGAFKVGLKSQPQAQIAIDFYNSVVRQHREFDGTYLQAESVTFDNTDWNQWKIVNVFAFDNQKENLDKRAPRFSDLYYTVLDKSDGSAELNCQANPTSTEHCEPFYNSMKGALNLTAVSGDKEAETLELESLAFITGEDYQLTGDYQAQSQFGVINATALKGTDYYAGDFVYRLNTGAYDTTDNRSSILDAIAAAEGNVLVDSFNYQVTPINGAVIQQKVAVYIQALERTTLDSSIDPNGFSVTGKFGTLSVTKVDQNYQYTYSFDESAIESSLSLASGASYQITDPFVYQLKSTAGTNALTEYLSVNVVIRKYTADADGAVRYYAEVNGNAPKLCDDTQVVCSSAQSYITGALTSDEIGGNTSAARLNYEISAVGRPEVIPVVTKVTLRDSNNNEIWVANNVLSTNPLFETNSINGADRLLATGELLRGKYGQFSVTDAGEVTYAVNTSTFATELAETDLRIVSEEFVLALSNNRRLPVTLTSVLQNFQGQQRLFVSANGEPLLQVDSSDTRFTGSLLTEDMPLSVLRAGRLNHSVKLRDAALDPVAIADGLRESLMFLQRRFYDTSVPIFGRMGGGPTSDTSGDGTDANAPAFIDRIMNVVESQILSQPHLTTEELTTLLNVVLQSVFAQYNVPLQVLKVDTEKLLFRLSYSAGFSSATDEYKTDWGMSGMGHFSGSTAGTFKYTIDLVFGVKLRTLIDEDGDSVLRHRIFIVTDKNTLASLMGVPQVEPVTLYDLKTWEGVNIGQTGVQFVNAQGKRLSNNSDVIKASNTQAINAGLKQEHDPTVDMQPQIKWRWKEEQSDKHWGASNNAKGTVKDFGTIIGYITSIAGTEEYAEFIAITLRQPESIGPNKVTPIQMSVVLDPQNKLKSNLSSDKYAKEALEVVFKYLKDNGGLSFDKQRLKVFDIYAEQHDPKQDQKSLHESQQLDVKWKVLFEEEVSSDPIGIHLPTYSAKLKVESVTVETEIDASVTVLPVDSMVADTQTISTPCGTSSNSGYKCKTEKLQITAVWKGNTESKRFFPTDKNAFKTKKTYSEVVQTAHGKLKLQGKVSGSKVNWTWEYSSLPAKSLNFGNENIIEVPKMTFQAEGNGCSGNLCVYSEYVITKHMLMFLDSQPVDDEAKMEAVSKITMDMAGSMEFRGDIQLWVVGASVNQATRSPSNVEEGTLIHPEEIFDNLVGSADAKQTIVSVNESDGEQAADITYIVGQYGVLGILPSGQYAYALKPELSLSTWALSCSDTEESIVNAVQAALKAQCDLLLSKDEDGNLVFWSDKTSAPSEPIYVKGYSFTCPSYNDLIAGNATCDVTSPVVLFTPEDRDQLTKEGVPSLESAINSMGTEMTGWQDTANLSNKKTLKDLYEQMQTAQTPDALNGVTELVDEFFVSVASDTAFRPLTISLGAAGSMEATFNEISTGGLASNEQSFGDENPITVNAWLGAKLNYHEPGIGNTLQVSTKPINPMAEANVFVDVALKIPELSTYPDEPGVIYPLDFTTKPKEIVQYTIGGNAALYAHINGGIIDPLSNNGDDDEHYQSFSLPGPSIAANIGLAAQFTGTGDFSDVSNRGAEFMFGAYNIELDLGEFISDKLVEPLGHLNNALEPIQPIANALTADMKIFSAINLEHVFDANQDGKVTILEVPTPFLEKSGPKAQKYEKQLMMVNRFLEFIASISDMIRIADELGDELAGVQSLQEQIISTDGYQVSPEVIRIVPTQSHSDLDGVSSQLVPYVNQLGHVVLGTDRNYQYIKTLGGTVGPSTVREMKPVQPAPAQNSTSKNSSMNKVKSRYNDLQKRGLISFPILSNPADVLKFVFGDPADLIILDVPDFVFDFEVQKGWRPPPVPIFLGKISGGFEMGTDTVLGVDTGGLLQTICGNDSPAVLWNCQGELADGDRAIRLLNSVFVRDWSDQSYYAGGDTGANKVFWQGNQRELPGYTVWDKHELAGNAEIDIGAGIDIGVFGAIFQGGPGLGGGIDLVDLCESTTPDDCETITNGEFSAGGYYDGKIRAYDFAMQMIDDSMSSFDMAFTFYVDFEAYIHTFHIKVWEELIGYFPLFVFDLDGAHWVGGAQSKSGAPLAGATLYFDANNNQKYDIGEPMTFTDAKGRGTIHIPYELYDRNLDRRIDAQDGTIRHFGGVNIYTGLGELEQVSIN